MDLTLTIQFITLPKGTTSVFIPPIHWMSKVLWLYNKWLLQSIWMLRVMYF